ncbi:DUF1254 domain-containing protein [Carboxylicivirga mesophila]|uniref:DUF1254 domain-containing protein n=1 Tax=Carboxylicivirga mesophila TaxID=1166478 RepID=A0ABS5KEY9_9BACT|nr:DUF1254 domain-containing protein [Carboxylicivirga mesophila]MBS2213624.1 DUF1254 domain-containing protein [Carboxylicivirga mesophila]
MTKTLNLLIALLATIALGACQPQTEKLSPQEAMEIAKEAYIYGFPMVMNYKTLDAYTLDNNSPEYKGEFNQKSCEARLYTPEDKAVVTPNSDTPYCMMWCNISHEPIVISVPDVEPERYYSFQLIDLYTHNFAYIGSLTTGSRAGKYLIAATDWTGEKPDGIDEIIRCETDLFLNIVRTQLMNENDIENVRAIQDQYQLQTLSQYMGNEPAAATSQNNFMAWNEGVQFTVQSFKYLSFILKHITPADEEKPLMARFAKLGIGTDAGFDLNAFDAATQDSIKAGVKAGFAEMETFIAQISSDPLASAKIFGTRDFLKKSATKNYPDKNMYLLRAVAAHLGLYGNSGEEAIYPAYLMAAPGIPFNAAENNYTLTFQEGELPPVKAFWSLTMYDGLTQLLVDNPLNRYLLNSSMENGFVYNQDGSLTLYIQKDSPGKELEANWLPAPDGPFYCILRLYGPTEEALSGAWMNPPIMFNQADKS